MKPNGITSLVFGCLFSSVCATAQTLPFKVGTAMRVITPCAPSYSANCGADYINVPYNIRVAGGNGYYDVDGVDVDSFDNGPADLNVRAVAIEDAQQHRMLLITIDVLSLSETFTTAVKRDLLASTSGLTPESILINVSHTENAPPIAYGVTGASCPVAPLPWARPQTTYIDAVQSRAISTAKSAIANLTPARLYFGRATTNVACYRRKENNASAPCDQSPAQPSPQPLDVLEARNASSQTLATIFFVSCHTATEYSNPTKISADYASEARKRIQSARGGTAVFVQGFAGDLNPTAGTSGLAAKQAAGTMVASDVSTAMQSATEISGLIHVASTIQPLALNTTSWPSDVMKWPHDWSSNIPEEYTLAVIGDDPKAASTWALLAMSNEVMSRFRDGVRTAAHDFTNLTLAGYTNRQETYLPTAAMIASDATGTNCNAVPYGYEGCRSFSFYMKPLPAWADSDVLTPVAKLAAAVGPWLVDDFSAPAYRATKWNIGGSSGVEHDSSSCDQGHDETNVTIDTSSQLTVHTAAMDGLYYNGYVSARAFDFTGRAASVKVINKPTAVRAEMLFSVVVDPFHLYGFSVQGNGSGTSLYIWYSLPQTSGDIQSWLQVTYSGEPYLRIRHDSVSDMIVWESSSDNVSWATLATLPRSTSSASAPALHAVRVELVAGSYLQTSVQTVTYGEFALK